MRIVIAGGGYAGVACAIDLHRQLPGAELHLVDPARAHLKLTHLHEALTRPLARLCTPFAELARQYGLTHHQATLGSGPEGEFDAAAIGEWSRIGRVPIRTGEGDRSALEFDALVLATGARPSLAAEGDEPRCADRDTLRKQEGEDFLARLAGAGSGGFVTVVGGGASGIQYVFALRDALHRRRLPHALRLVSADAEPVAAQPEPVRRYVRGRLADAGVECLFEHEYAEQRGTRLRVRTPHGDPLELESELTLLFGGVRPHPASLQGDRYGRVLAEAAVLPGVYAAGDCVQFAAPGLNSLTAQAAVRKGRLVAANIARAARGRALLPYRYHELGYVVSLGELDAAGWVGARTASVTGMTAAVIKQAVEVQYDLFVGGIDTYIG